MTEPDVVEGDGHIPNIMWAMWEEDEDDLDAHIGFWKTSDGRIAVQSLQANRNVRGRDMMRWLMRYGMPVHVVEAIPEAYGFWDRMMAEGLIIDWAPADGFTTELERLSVPFGDVAQAEKTA